MILVEILKKGKKNIAATNSVSVVFSRSAEKHKNNWSCKGNGPQHWVPKIRSEDKYFPRKVTKPPVIAIPRTYPLFLIALAGFFY